MTEIEKMASDLGVSEEQYKIASILEGMAMFGFTDELNKAADVARAMPEPSPLVPAGEDEMIEVESDELPDELKKKANEDYRVKNFFDGFAEIMEKEAGMGAAVQKSAPYLAGILGLGGIGTGMYALNKQKKETATTRAGVMNLAGGVGRALGGLGMKQRYNTMRDVANESALAKGVNQNRAALRSLIGSKRPAGA